MKKTKIVIFFLLIIIVVYYFFIKSYAQIELINSSLETIDTITVKICAEESVLTQLNPNEHRDIRLLVSGDCHYSVKAIFKSGKTLENSFGYVSSSANYNSTIEISDKEILLKKSLAKSLFK